MNVRDGFEEMPLPVAGVDDVRRRARTRRNRARTTAGSGLAAVLVATWGVSTMFASGHGSNATSEVALPSPSEDIHPDSGALPGSSTSATVLNGLAFYAGAIAILIGVVWLALTLIQHRRSPITLRSTWRQLLVIAAGAVVVVLFY